MKITDQAVRDSLPKQLTIKEVSKLFGISEWTLRAYVSKRQIPHRRIGRRTFLYSCGRGKLLQMFYLLS